MGVEVSFFLHLSFKIAVLACGFRVAIHREKKQGEHFISRLGIFGKYRHFLTN